MARRSARVGSWPRDARERLAVALLPLLAVAAACGGSAGGDADQPSQSGAGGAAGQSVPAAIGTATAATSVPPVAPASFVPGERCVTAQLQVTLKAPNSGDLASQQNVPLVFTNTSDTMCVMTGYPGVTLRSKSADDYDLPRSTRVTPAGVVVQPGGAAQAVLTYGPAAPGDDHAFVPTTVVVTAPDEFDHVVLTWSHGPVTDQRAATHPATYISALTTAP